MARKPSKSGPGGPDSSPADPGKPSFYLRGVDDFSPGLEGRVGDQFWHPQGVQVKAPNSRILSSPPSNGPLSITKPYKLIGFGAIAITKPYEFIGFGAMDITKPYKFVGFGVRVPR